MEKVKTFIINIPEPIRFTIFSCGMLIVSAVCASVIMGVFVAVNYIASWGMDMVLRLGA